MRAQLVERSPLLGGRAIAAVILGAILDELGVKPWTRFAIVRGADGYAANIPIELAHDCVLVYAIGDAPLPDDLCGPFRIATDLSERAAEVEAACPHAIRAGTLLTLPGRS